MGVKLVLLFLVLFGLAIGQALLRRARNPFETVSWESLPDTLRSEVQRVVPGFEPEKVLWTKARDEVRVDGRRFGDPASIEAKFDASGALVELEFDAIGGVRVRRLADASDLPAPARSEVERVVGQGIESLERLRVTAGSAGNQSATEGGPEGAAGFAVKGLAGPWKWEVEVRGDGRLLEVEKERRRR